jgi:tetratricopeptide (TPR) repeat protein
LKGAKADAAIAAARLAVERNPHGVWAWVKLASMLVERGELEEARDCYQRAVQIDPGFVPGLNDLAVVLQRLGQLRAAEACYREALKLAPEEAEVQLNFAALLGALGRYRDALEIVEGVIKRDPAVASAHLLASALEQGMGRDKAALARIEQAPLLGSDSVRVLTQRAEILRALGRSEGALGDCERALEQLPNDPKALHIKAQLLQELDRPTAALEAFRCAEAVMPSPAGLIADRAWLLAELGSKGEALAALDRALGLQPDLAIAWYRRTYLHRYGAGAPDLALMQELVENPNTAFPDRIILCFALGKAYLDMTDGGRAFKWLDSGNRMKRAVIEYHSDASVRRFHEIAATFSADQLSRLRGCSVSSSQAIFVFGMPRSGTTLIEQILASHPLVRGRGESTHLHDLAEAAGYPGRVAQLSPRDLATLGHRYLKLLAAELSQIPHLVDKTPMNFLYAGLISLMLPNARMIHCRRDPLDTCLSCYSLLFKRGHEYSYDQSELGRFYRLYRALMSHWRGVLPPERLLELDYETLVSDTEHQVRKILDFCALPWDDSCLRFYDTRRRVATSSLDQVRSPIYTSSVGRAQAFRAWLGPLETALMHRA